MSWIFYDPDEWETVVEGESYPGPFGVPYGYFSVGYRRRPQEEIDKIKEKKRLEYEDSVLAEAEAILARRKGTL